MSRAAFLSFFLLRFQYRLELTFTFNFCLLFVLFNSSQKTSKQHFAFRFQLHFVHKFNLHHLSLKWKLVFIHSRLLLSTYQKFLNYILILRDIEWKHFQLRERSEDCKHLLLLPKMNKQQSQRRTRKSFLRIENVLSSHVYCSIYSWIV